MHLPKVFHSNIYKCRVKINKWINSTFFLFVNKNCVDYLLYKKKQKKITENLCTTICHCKKLHYYKCFKYVQILNFKVHFDLISKQNTFVHRLLRILLSFVCFFFLSMHKNSNHRHIFSINPSASKAFFFFLESLGFEAF